MYSFYLPQSGGSSNEKNIQRWEQPQKPLSTAGAGSFGSRLALLFYSFIMLFATTLTAGASPIEVKASTETLSSAYTCYLKIQYSYPPIVCYGGTTNLTITASGGVAPYQYSINDGTSWQTGNVFYGLKAGYYKICIKDCKGCYTCITICIVEPKCIVIQPSYPPIVCYGGTTTLTVNATGGAGGYQYSINNGATYQTSNVFTNLKAGYYTVCVKDCKGCVKCIVICIKQPTEIVITPSYPPILCYGGTTTLTVNATGGAGGYQYSINNGATYQTSNVFANLKAGTYTICVKDCKGCIVCKTITIGEPKELEVVCGPNSPPTSGTSNDGSLSVVVSGGTPPYTYTLTGGGITPRTGTTSNTTIPFTGLGPGVYTIKIVDKNNCYDQVECQVPPPVTPPCGPFPNVYTQGGYGQEPNGGNVGAFLQANFSGQIVIGVQGNCPGTTTAGKYLLFNSAAAIRAFLPSGTTPRPLDITATNPTREDYRNNFAGQVLTLALNVRFNPGLAGAYITSGPLRCQTVATVLAQANLALGGCTSAYSLSALHEAATKINESKGSTSGFLSCTNPCARVGVNETNQASFENTNGLRITAAPNPSSLGRTTIQFSVAETTEAEVNMYSITGAKIGTLFKGRAEAGQVYKVEFNGVNAKGQGLKAGTYIYQLSTPTAAKHGRLIFLNR
ncbi:MAG: SprB repeat-containing protein [Cytophagales bacterium]|nr:SprB repeat-containing protein [Cytophagales bacterium]